MHAQVPRRELESTFGVLAYITVVGIHSLPGSTETTEQRQELNPAVGEARGLWSPNLLTPFHDHSSLYILYQNRSNLAPIPKFSCVSLGRLSALSGCL